MHRPYQLRGIDHLSASAIRAYCECEAESAYNRNFVGVPNVKLPVARAYGTAAHKLLEQTGKHWWKLVARTGKPIDGQEGRNFVKYGRMFVEKVLTEKVGARGVSSEVVPLLWPFEKEKQILSDAEYKDKFDEEVGKYLGRIYNTLEAFRLQFTVPSNIMDMRFELDFSRHRIVLETKRGPLKLHGQIDRVELVPNGYLVYDYKTGWIVKSYQNRRYVVEDLQMTIYHYVMQLLEGIGPKAMYIQPVELASSFLREHGPLALQKKAIHIPDRSNPEYVKDIQLLGADVWDMVDMVVRSNYYSKTEKEEWEPQSSYGKKASFKDCVQQERFVPRIGDWCVNCSFINLCQVDHQEDWQAYELQHKRQIKIDDGPVVQLLPIIEAQQKLDTLFPMEPRRSIYLNKGKKELRNRMINSKNFVAKARLIAVLNKVVNMMRELGPCPCVEPKLRLFPIWILPYLPKINSEHVSIAEVCKNCPHQNCPRTTS